MQEPLLLPQQAESLHVQWLPFTTTPFELTWTEERRIQQQELMQMFRITPEMIGEVHAYNPVIDSLIVWFKSLVAPITQAIKRVIDVLVSGFSSVPPTRKRTRLSRQSRHYLIVKRRIAARKARYGR